MRNEFFKFVGKTRQIWMLATGLCIGQVVQYNIILAIVTMSFAILMLIGAMWGDN